MCQRKRALFLKLHYQAEYFDIPNTAERCIFSTANFCLMDLNMPASCLKLMTSLHNVPVQLRVAVVRVICYPEDGDRKRVRLNMLRDRKQKHPGKV